MRWVSFGLLLAAFAIGCAAAKVPAVNKPLDPPFHAAWWCSGPNAQTIWGSILRPTPRVPLQRERWETPDGDFIDVDLMPGPAGSPILIAFHGLEGSSRSKQILGLLFLARRNGWRGVAMNFRTCSGQINRLRRSYHGGETSDPKWLIERVARENPDAPIFCVGVSLGANILLKYFGEEGDAVPQQVRAAAAISTPFDLQASARGLEKGFSRTYMKRLVQSLKAKTLAKMEKYPDLADRQRVLAAETLEEFDDAVTGPVHGFRDARDYWAHSSSNQFVARIRRPTLLISAKDDPFLPESAIPFAAVSENHFLTGVFTEKGGHVGFISGAWPGRAFPWAEHRAIRFFERHLPSDFPARNSVNKNLAQKIF